MAHASELLAEAPQIRKADVLRQITGSELRLRRSSFSDLALG
jgi:hypothetical protein